MKTRQILFSALIIITSTSFAQDEKKMSKNLRVFISENFNRKTSITIQSLPYDIGGSVGSFTNALASKGLKTISSTSISNKTEIEESKIKTENSTDKKTSISNTNYVKSKYLFTIQYSYVSSMDHAVQGMRRGTVQCKNFTGQIVDLNNDSEVIATFSYSGNFDMDAVAQAVAEKLNAAKTTDSPKIIVTDTSKVSTPTITPTKATPKTKEEKLIELKQFYEKQLITKEEYEDQKKKVLAE
ncbi:MAG: SHOCT domain-containing protein [Bacteroidota bacterium]